MQDGGASPAEHGGAAESAGGCAAAGSSGASGRRGYAWAALRVTAGHWRGAMVAGDGSPRCSVKEVVFGSAARLRG